MVPLVISFDWFTVFDDLAICTLQYNSTLIGCQWLSLGLAGVPLTLGLRTCCGRALPSHFCIFSEHLMEFCAVQQTIQQTCTHTAEVYVNKRPSKMLSAIFQSAEAHPLCGRLKLTELTPIAWSRLTKYKLLVEGLIKQFVGQRTKLDNLTGEGVLMWYRFMRRH